MKNYFMKFLFHKKMLKYYIFYIFIIIVFLKVYFIGIKEIDYQFRIDKNYLKKRDIDFNFPVYEEEDYIPHNIYRLEYRNVDRSLFSAAHDITLSNVSDSKQFIYTDDDIPEFILKYYNQEVLDIYNTINISYGACRADLVRLLLIYAFGGIYLDYKTAIVKNFDVILNKYHNKLIVSKQSNIPYTACFCSIASKYGEYVNWGFCSNKGNPILRKIINTVLYNLKDAYKNKEKYKAGRIHVSYLTGPLVFTTVINSSDRNKYSLINSEFNGKCVKNYIQHHKIIGKNHWSKVREPLFV